MNNVPVENTVPFPDLNHTGQIRRAALAMIPFTPVVFSDPLAWVRIGLYGTIAYATFKRSRPLSYAALGAAAMSISTSLAAQYWNKENGGSV